MSFNYKNPITPLSTLGNISVQRKNVFGTNFSILSTGGYMEVYNINELYYTIPPSTTGLIEFSGNTIPIQLNKGTGSPFSFDVLTLNSDNISSGRRRLGMLVNVIDEDQIYQYQIPNFIPLWNSATGATGPGGNTVIFSDFGTTVKSNTPEGVAFISAWTSNVIEGVSGGTSVNSTWKKLVTGGGEFTGGTVTGDTIFTNGLTANTFSASTYLGLPGDIFITGGTFDNNTDTLTLDRSSGSSITITGFTDYFTTGATLIGDTIYFDRNDTLSAYTVNLSSFTPSVDVFVTGGTYSAGTSTFTNNTGGTFDVTGFYTGETDDNTYITGFTYSSNTFTISDNSGTTFNSTFNDVTGLTINGDLSVTGNTTLDGLTANTISSTTINTISLGTSANCVSEIYVSNINSCSPLHIQPLSGTGNVYIGENGGVNVGIGTSLPTEVLNIYKSGFNQANLLVESDSLNATLILGSFKNSQGTSGGSQILFKTLGNNKVDMNFNSATDNYNITSSGGIVQQSGYGSLHLINTSYSDLNLRADRGNVVIDTTNSGNVLINPISNVGIGTSTPSEKLEVSGKTKTTNFQMTSGATNGYILTSDGSGNASWSPLSGTTGYSSTYSAGILLNSSGWTSTGTGQINLPQVDVALFNNPNFIEPVSVYTISSGTTGVLSIPSLQDNDTNYIIIEYNGGSPRYNVLNNDGTINDSDVVLYLIVYRAGNFVHVLDFGNQGAGLPNKLNDRVIMTDRFARESGFSLGLSGSTGVVTLTSGVAWNGTNRQTLVGVNSQDDIFFKNFHSGGTWVYETTGNTLNNEYYDNGTNPVLATSGKYLVNWYFRGQEVNDHLYEVYGTDEYDSVSEAQLSVEPTLPELITSHAFLTGRIIVQVSATTGYVESAFVRVFQSTTVTEHNDLLGLQGGLGGQYYHLDSNQYNNLPLLNSNNVFQSGITANTISATTYFNLPTDIRVTGATYSNNTFTYTNNTGGTFNVNFNTVTGLTVNGNLSVTGNTTLKAFSGTSGYISGSGQNILTVVGSGNSTTSPLFSVQGSNGELFSVTDSLIGSLFSVNDISGLPILEVFSDNTTLMGSYLSPSLNTTTKVSLTAGTNTIYSIPTSAYTGAFFDYTLISTGSTGARAGTIMSIWSGSTAQYTETSTNDIGTTTGVTFSVAVSGSNAVLSSSATTAGWTVKTIVRSI